jgi:hypothetical protein
MSREELLVLAERVEQATADQQAELLADAWDALGPIANWTGDQARRFGMMMDAEAFESAAMSLVPDGWCVFLNAYVDGAEVALEDDRVDPVRFPSVHAEAVTPALALVSASLRAMAAMGEGL